MRHLVPSALVLLLIGCWPGEQPYRHYGTHEEAVAAGERERGWLPDWVPSSATSIHLQGDLDTNRVWLRFSLPPPARGELRTRLRPLGESESKNAAWPRPDGARAWWPRNLVQRSPADDIALNAELFEVAAQGQAAAFVVAFERGNSEVFAWSQH